MTRMCFKILLELGNWGTALKNALPQKSTRSRVLSLLDPQSTLHWRSSLRYIEARLFTALYVRSRNLYSVRCRMGNQWSFSMVRDVLIFPGHSDKWERISYTLPQRLPKVWISCCVACMLYVWYHIMVMSYFVKYQRKHKYVSMWDLVLKCVHRNTAICNIMASIRYIVFPTYTTSKL